MASFYFDYDIKNVLDPKLNCSKDLMFFIEKQFDESANRIKYVLSLVIRRKVVFDDNNQVLSVEYPNPEFKYIHIVHDKKASFIPLYSLKDADNVLYYVDKYNIGLVDENRKEINKKYRYIKYTFNDLEEDEITGYGYIGFTKEKNEESVSKNRYYYYCNFKRKVEVFYDIENRGNKLKIDITVPKIAAKIDLNIAYSDTPSYQLQNFFNETISLTKGDSLKRISRVINNEHPDKFYKLAFKDLELNNYLILVKDNVDKKSGLNEKVMPQDNTVYCPFCLEKINTDFFAQIEKNKVSNNLVSCRGKTSKATIYENDKLVSEQLFYCDNYYQGDGGSVNNLLIPKGYLKMTNKLISILGLPASGKSVYLSTIFGLQNGDSANLSYLNSFFKKFNFNFSLDFFKSLGNEYIQMGSNGQIALNPYKHQSYMPIYNNGGFSFNNVDEEMDFANESMYDDFKIDFERAQFLRTDSQTRFLPFILTSNKTNIVISDIAGEDAKKIMNMTPDEARNSGAENKSKKINLANGYIILVSPQDSNFEETFKRILHEENKDIPIAVVLSKFDELDLAKFDPSCACLRDDTYQMMSNAYEGSKLQLNIDQSSLEIKDYIKQHIPNVPVGQLESFTNVRYFVVSSIGDKACAINNFNNGESSIMFYNTPFRVELPLIWILYHMGIIS